MATHLSLCSTISISSPRPILAPRHRFTVSCNAGDDGRASSSSSQGKVDRRNLLVGMGGLYAATNLVSTEPPALAGPISVSEKTECVLGKKTKGVALDEKCCPPESPGIIPYVLPGKSEPMRIRRPAHQVEEEDIKKYEEALRIMKSLPDDDPRSFKQQANVHCAYCNLSYLKDGYKPDENDSEDEGKIQIHFSWLFFPWHRWHLYFYERILGDLIKDPTFALPFWNWDDPNGMAMPYMFARYDSALNNPRRNQEHMPFGGKPPLVNLSYAKGREQPNRDITIESNLREMYTTMVRTQCLEDFYGAKYSAQSKNSPGAGAVERGSHTAVHVWVGDPRSPYGEDLGNFYSAGRDPLFYSHHANVDRMWSIWCKQRREMGRSQHFNDKDFLDASFLFYNEKKELVNVTVEQALDNEEMGYKYEEVDLPWKNKKPTPRATKSKAASTTPAEAIDAESIDMGKSVKLDKVARVFVKRHKVNRSDEEKKKDEEILVIDIEVEAGKFVRFDVYVNDDDDQNKDVDDIKKSAAYAGCYSQVPSRSVKPVKSKIRLGLNELLKDLKIEDDDQILVSLVPRAGGGDITIRGIKIDFCSLN